MYSEGRETSVNIYLQNISHIYCTYWISAVWSKSAVGRKKTTNDTYKIMRVDLHNLLKAYIRIFLTGRSPLLRSEKLY